MLRFGYNRKKREPNSEKCRKLQRLKNVPHCFFLQIEIYAAKHIAVIATDLRSGRPNRRLLQVEFHRG
jgi:hypothetical protein